MRATFLGLGLVVTLAGAAHALGEEYLKTLDDGVQEAKRSNMAILYVTKWKSGV